MNRRKDLVKKGIEGQDGNKLDIPAPSFFIKMENSRLDWRINGISYTEFLGWLELLRDQIIKKISENIS